MDGLPAWQLSLLIGGGTFAGLSFYNRVTQDPEEINKTPYMLKASAITSLIALVITSVIEQRKPIGPSEKILTKFDTSSK